MLNATSALVWSLLGDWRDPVAIDRVLAAQFPSIAVAERTAGLWSVIETLSAEGLLERRRP